VYKFLWGHPDLRNLWTFEHFKLLAHFLLRNTTHADTLLDFHLNAGANLFLSAAPAERLDFVRSLGASDSVQAALAQSHYAPYLLVQLIEKQTFMKLKDYRVYDQCLEYATHFELEELSRRSEIEELFVKFLKYIEIMSSTDPKKVAGQRLIAMIFSVDKYKAY
jgi:hypothetical protein